MDEFNDRLKKACAPFMNVTYLNVRDIVRFSPDHGVDQWYDEIHPNNEGFQLVAMKFIQVIDALIGEKAVSETRITLEEALPRAGVIPGGAILSTSGENFPKAEAGEQKNIIT
jgi:hypothetical protein